MNQLPTEIIYNILQYAGELRVLKRKMTKENVFQIINDDESIITFIYDIVDRPIRTGPPIYYFVYWNYLKTLSNNKIMNNYNLPQNMFDKLMNVFINDYNNYYLDDNYYIDIVWYHGVCYSDFWNEIEKDKKHEIEEYRFEVFYEICEYIFENEDKCLDFHKGNYV